jgi:hypothetical protein
MPIKPALLSFCFLLVACSGQPSARPELRVSYAYDDIARFNAVYPELAESEDAEKLLQERYIDPGSAALGDYIARYQLKPLQWIKAIEKRPRYFGSFADLVDRLRAEEPQIDAAYDRLRTFYPTARPLRVNYVIGPMLAGGIQAASGVIVSAEIYGRRPDTDSFEFSSRSRLYPTQKVAPIVIHEFAHSMQMDLQGRDAYIAIYGDRKSLLAIAIREGTADFIAALSTGETINPAAHAYGEPRQAQLWPLFQREMQGKETGDWMFYKPKAHSDWPRDLGYFMGYKIVEAYYNNADDKNQALSDILGVTDYAALVAGSGYGPG